jgi:UPF0271 protein
MTTRIDMNCDMGESYGAWTMGNDAAVLQFVSSANIACGFHGGDPATMRKTVAAALARGVALGAHPSLQDLAGFGRRVIQISPDEAYDIVVYQIGALAGVAASQGARLHHVKAHGALYNMAAKDEGLARAICQAVKDVDPSLILYGLAGSKLIDAARAIGLAAANEVFADRSYQDDGSLTPRSRAGAMIEDLDQAVAQVVRMVREGKVRSVDGKDVPVQADTLCIHGDQPNALLFADGIRRALEHAGIEVRTPPRGRRAPPAAGSGAAVARRGLFFVLQRSVAVRFQYARQHIRQVAARHAGRALDIANGQRLDDAASADLDPGERHRLPGQQVAQGLDLFVKLA